MSTEGLLFIPDISGFSRFVEKTDIVHSQMIIQHLLETLINCNQLQLQVSEIEGDAILFYKFGAPPTMKDLYQQVEKMFCDFHQLLRSMSVRKLCQCGACREAEHLSLKIITCHGEFTSYNVKEHCKLLGKNVIRAHQLLKNDINKHEYWLVTDNLYRQYYKAEDMPEWMQWLPGSKAVENDSISFRYAYLSPLLDRIPEESLFPTAAQLGKTEMTSVTKEMEADFMKLYYLVINHELRPQWIDGLKAIDKMGHQDNMVGVPHRCIFDKNELVFVTSHIKATDTSIAYEETTDKKDMTIRYVFQQTGPGRASVTESLYLKSNFLKNLLFRLLMKRKSIRLMERSLENLSALYKKEIVRSSDFNPRHQHLEHDSV